MDVEESWFIFKEIVKAVQLTHRSGVIHRYLKPDNIFFGNADTNAIKLGDFGHACWAKQYAAGEAGTPNRGTNGIVLLSWMQKQVRLFLNLMQKYQLTK
jgi:serine/threonine protein kinase